MERAHIFKSSQCFFFLCTQGPAWFWPDQHWPDQVPKPQILLVQRSPVFVPSPPLFTQLLGYNDGTLFTWCLLLTPELLRWLKESSLMSSCSGWCVSVLMLTKVYSQHICTSSSSFDDWSTRITFHIDYDVVIGLVMCKHVFFICTPSQVHQAVAFPLL